MFKPTQPCQCKDTLNTRPRLNLAPASLERVARTMPPSDQSSPLTRASPMARRRGIESGPTRANAARPASTWTALESRVKTRPPRQPGPPSSQRGGAGVNLDRSRVNATVASTRTPSSQRRRAGVNPDPPRVNAAVASTRTPLEATQRGRRQTGPPRVNAAVESS